MEKSTFYNLINFDYPEGFEQLSDRENQKYFTGNLMRVSLLNKEKHILFSISKSKDSFINRIMNIKVVMRSSLSNFQNNLKDYQLIEQYESLIFGQPAITVCFSYTANDKDVKQYGEFSIFKVKKAIYAVYCISLFENKEDTKEIFKQFKDSFVAANP